MGPCTNNSIARLTCFLAVFDYFRLDFIVLRVKIIAINLLLRFLSVGFIMSKIISIQPASTPST